MKDFPVCAVLSAQLCLVIFNCRCAGDITTRKSVWNERPILCVGSANVPEVAVVHLSCSVESF